MRKRLLVATLAIAILSLVVPNIASCQLTVQDDAGKLTGLSKADIEALPHVRVTVTGGSSMTSLPMTSSSMTSTSTASTAFEGVALKAVLEKAGVASGESLRGKRMASCLLVEAADGYRVVIALPEFDPAFTDKQIVVAFLKDGKPLDEKEGPYRLVIPDEKRMARWVKQVTKLKIVDVQ
jgi:hypothetical protein